MITRIWPHPVRSVDWAAVDARSVRIFERKKEVKAGMSKVKHKYRPLGVAQLRRSLVFQPLAVLMVILLLPAVSWWENGFGSRPDSSSSVFQAQAQIVVGGACDPQPKNAIIQTVCVGTAVYGPDLFQFESDSVAAYLALHNLPASDAHLVYDSGRTDLRSAIRSTMYANLLAIIQKPSTQRSAHEQTLYKWMQSLVQQNEIAEYTAAVSQYQAFENNPCGFTLDPVIASEYQLSYDIKSYCADPYTQAFNGLTVPAESYFLAYGLQQSYGKPALTYSNFGSVVAATQLGLGEALGIGGSVGALVAAGAGAAIATFAGSIFPFALGASAPEFFVAGAWLANSSASAFGAGSAAVGPAAIVFIAIAIGVTAGFQVFSNQKVKSDLDNLSNLLTSVTNTPPDLNAFATDSTSLGLYKLNETFTAQTLPDLPSANPLPAFRNGTDSHFSITPAGGTPVDNTKLQYQDWSGSSWTVENYGGWFVQTCNNDGAAKCPQADSITASIHYIDWNGTKWTASRFGSHFVSTKGAVGASDRPCLANAATGISDTSNVAACSSYTSSSIPLKDASGTDITVGLSFPVQFTSPSTFYFTAGQPGTALIAAVGIPTPAITEVSGPSNVGVFFADTSLGGAEIVNTAPSIPGTYQVVVSASNGTGAPVQQVITVVVSTNVQITSTTSPHVVFGLPTTITVTTTGYPAPTLTPSPGLLFDGLSFVDNKNGTATISGTPTGFLGSGQPPCQLWGAPSYPAGCTITATNGASSVTQTFNMTGSQPPPAHLVTTSASFVAGIPNSFLVTSAGAISPVTFEYQAGYGWPSWLMLHDNGDGTAVLSGTPPDLTSGPISVAITPFAFGLSGYALIPNFTLNVNGTPVFTTLNSADFTVGTDSSFEINTTGAFVSEHGALPNGLNFQSGLPAYITGTPAAHTGGSYALNLDAADLLGHASQPLTLNIYERPEITSVNSFNFYVGMQNSFAVTTTGYPSLSLGPVPYSGPAGGRPDNGQGMTFTVTSLPPDLATSNQNGQNYATGTLIISGSPSTSDIGRHTIDVRASNGVDRNKSAYLRMLLLIGGAPGDVNQDGVVNCRDFDLVNRALNTTRGHAGYRADWDVNNDGVIDELDLSIVRNNLATGTVCQ